VLPFNDPLMAISLGFIRPKEPARQSPLIE
jgi:hypothetical protein